MAMMPRVLGQLRRKFLVDIDFKRKTKVRASQNMDCKMWVILMFEMFIF